MPFFFLASVLGVFDDLWIPPQPNVAVKLEIGGARNPQLGDEFPPTYVILKDKDLQFMLIIRGGGVTPWKRCLAA